MQHPDDFHGHLFRRTVEEDLGAVRVARASAGAAYAAVVINAILTRRNTAILIRYGPAVFQGPEVEGKVLPPLPWKGVPKELEELRDFYKRAVELLN